MRVAVVHSFYSNRQPSGENVVVDRQVQALKQAGHSVALLSQMTDDRASSHMFAAQAAFTVASGIGPSPLQELHEFCPDVVHIHNLFPNYGRRWVLEWPGAIVATMHNFRPLCPAATFFRDGSVCTDCLERGNAWPSVRHGCYRGSRVHTVPLALSTKFAADPVLRRAERLVVLNPAMRGLYERAGVERHRIRVLPNFGISSPLGTGGGPWLYVGRLTEEKGIAQLVREWPSDRSLLIAGDGPLRAEISKNAASSVTLLGSQPQETVHKLMSEAIGLVFPSQWLEGFPMVYLEALSVGTPVLAWPSSSVADQVESDGTGLIVDDLGSSLARAEKVFPTLREHCHAVFVSKYTESSWAKAIGGIYRDAIAQAGFAE